MNNISDNESHLDFYKRRDRLAKPYFKWQLRNFMPYIGRRIADVGCGMGNFVKLFTDKELYLGFELNEELSNEFKLLHRTSAARLAVNGDICCDEAVEEMKKAEIDTVICINVLEHITDDRRALSNIVNGINSGGHICIFVPAFGWLYGSLDELDGHYRRYTKKTMSCLVQEMNVDIIKCSYINLLGAIGWYVKGRIFKDKRSEDSNYILMNKLLPIVSFAEKIVPPPFGLSLVVVLKKR